MNVPRRKRWIRIGSVGLGISLSTSTDERITKAAAVRRLIKPLLGFRARGRKPATGYRPWHKGPIGSSNGRSRLISPDPQVQELQEQVAAIDWYHSIDLGHGIVTQGLVDHRPQLPLYRLPESLRGMRCLDVASMDGFWAFEMEKRGAAEVVAIDIERRIDMDLPYRVREEVIRTGQDAPAAPGFELAHRILGSKVKKRILSVYDLSPEIVGQFDFIFLSDLLLHIRNPQLALERVRSVCRGIVYIADVCHPGLENVGDLCLAEYRLWAPGEPIWWRLNANTLKRMMSVAGFQTVEELSRFRLNVPGALAGNLPAKVVLRGKVANDSVRNELPESR